MSRCVETLEEVEWRNPKVGERALKLAREMVKREDWVEPDRSEWFLDGKGEIVLHWDELEGDGFVVFVDRYEYDVWWDGKNGTETMEEVLTEYGRYREKCHEARQRKG